MTIYWLGSDKVNYKIFDKSHKDSTLIYSKFKFNDAAKLAEVEANCQIVIRELEGDKIYLPKQVHGKNILVIDHNTNFAEEAEADGIITTLPKIVIGVQTADCVPVLLASSSGGVIGAVHAGWRSAKAGIIKEVIDKMYAAGANKIQAIVGPSIQQDSYEVSGEYYRDFIKDDPAYHNYFIPSKNAGHYMFNLPGFVINKLQIEGVDLALHINEDTYKMSNKYPSYRRSCHTGEKYQHNILSAIVIV